MDDPLFWATLALVALTAFYAWQTRQTVNEMRRARGQAMFPRLKASIRAKAAGAGWIRITNVGPGAALDVTARFELVPDGGETTWRAHVVASGESSEFLLRPEGAAEPMYRLDELTERFSHIRLRADYRDVLGDPQTVDESIEIRDWWATTKAAHHLVDKDWPEEQAIELERIRKELVKIGGEATKLRQATEPKPWRWELRVRRFPARLQPTVRRVFGRLGLLDC